MKKIAFVILFISTLLFAGIKPQPIFAAGTVCCPGDHPIARGGKCVQQVGGLDWDMQENSCRKAAGNVVGQGCNINVNSGRGECFDIATPIAQTQSCPTGDGTCINSGIGFIHTDYEGFLGQVITFGIGLGSGIAFFMLVYGSYQLITSQGNPEGINHGKETITAAVVGLVFVALSVSVLQILGVDILGLKNLGFGGR